MLTKECSQNCETIFKLISLKNLYWANLSITSISAGNMMFGWSRGHNITIEPQVSQVGLAMLQSPICQVLKSVRGACIALIAPKTKLIVWDLLLLPMYFSC